MTVLSYKPNVEMRSFLLIPFFIFIVGCSDRTSVYDNDWRCSKKCRIETKSFLFMYMDRNGVVAPVGFKNIS